MGQPVAQAYHYKRLHYTEVEDKFKDACFQMYWHCCQLLELDPDEKSVPIRFITLTEEKTQACYTTPRKVRGFASVEDNSINICTSYALDYALYTVAHEMKHIHQLKLMEWTVGFPKMYNDILERDADRFAEEACNTFVEQYGYQFD